MAASAAGHHLVMRWIHRGHRDQSAASGRAGAAPAPVTITIDVAAAGPVIPDDFAGLSFEVGPLNPGHAGVRGYLFSPDNESLVTLFRSLGLRNLRVGGGSVDQRIPVGTGSDGFRGIDNLFAFAAAAGAKVIYTFRLLNPAAAPVADLKSVNAAAAGYIWSRYRENLASFAIGNEPDWHDFHSYAGRPRDTAIYEEVSGVPGSAYPSFLATWRSFADAIREAAPGAPLSGPDTGAYSPMTWTPDPDRGVSWTQRFAGDEPDPGQVTDLTQHYYVGGGPGKTGAGQAIANMLSPEWVHAAAPGAQPRGTTYTPYPWFYETHVAPAVAAGRRLRLTEANDYLGGVPGASNGYASALWTLDFLHWWAAHGAGGVNFHNKQWLDTDTIVPDPAAPGRYMTTPKGYGVKAFTLGSAGQVGASQVRPVTVGNPGGVNLTAYAVGGDDMDYVTIINKTQGAGAADAAVTIVPPGPGLRGAEAMTLAGAEWGDASGTTVTLGGAAISGDAPWEGEWSTLPADPEAGITLTVPAATAAVVRIRGGGSAAS